MNEALLTEIITRLLASPELKSLLETKAVRGEQEEKPGCLILVNSQADVKELPALTARYSPDYTVGICITGQAAVTDQRLKRFSYEQATGQTNWGRIHLPECSQDQLAQIALGLSCDPVCKLVSWAITQGLAVEIGRVNRAFTAQTPDSYRQLFAAYAQQVASFGVIIANHEAAPQSHTTEPIPVYESMNRPVATAQLSHPEIHYEKRLLTVKEALQLPPNGIIRIAKSTVVAPGAIDVLKKQKIEVYREGVRCW